MEFTILSSALKAASFASGIKDIRHMINSVCIEYYSSEPDKLHVLGTDGHRLHYCVSTTESHIGQNLQLIVPLSTVKDALRLKSNMLTFRFNAGAWCINNSLIFVPIEGKYPDWLRVLPASLSGDIGQYNPAYLLEAHDAICAYKSIKPDSGAFVLTHNGSSGGVMCADGIICLVMPLTANRTQVQYVKPTLGLGVFK